MSNIGAHTNFMSHILKRYDSGQTLIEIILALSVAVAVITGITFAITSSIKNATFTKNQNLASSYAQQGMETVRVIRDSSWVAFSSFDGFFCLSQGSQQLTSRVGSNCEGPGEGEIFVGGTKFIRQVRMQVNNTDCEAGVPGTPNTKATVSVQWSDSICGNVVPTLYCHQVELVTCFTQSNVVPIP